MHIDSFLSKYDFRETHALDISASAHAIYNALPALDLSNSLTARLLFYLRGMPSFCLHLDGLLNMGFVILADDLPREFVLGVAGKFWRVSGGIAQPDPSSFKAFDTPRYAKAVWNFSLSELNNRSTRVTTETRILCTDEQSRRLFRRYWLIVKPFS